MLKQIECPSLTSVGLGNQFKQSQFIASCGEYIAVTENEQIHFIQTSPAQVIYKIPAKVDMAMPHPTQKGNILVKRADTVSLLDSNTKQSLAAGSLPANTGTTYTMKYIDGLLHVVTSSVLLRFTEGLDKCFTICNLTEMFQEQQSLVTSFTGNVELNVYAISAVVGGKAKTAMFNQKLQVIPEMISSCMSVFNEQVFLTTAPMGAMKVTTVNLTKMVPAQTVISTEANELVKSMVVFAKSGIVAMFTSTQKIFILDLFTMHILTELKTSAQVVMSAATATGAIYVQQDGRVFSLTPEVQLLASTLQTKLSASEQYQHFIQTALMSGAVQFTKIYKQYLEESFKAQNWTEVARIIADSVKFKAEDVRNQQLIDKISLSDRKAFLLFASQLVQTYGVKLNINESLTLIRLLHQENMLGVALPKFIDNDYLEIEEGNEKPGMLIVDLAGQPIPTDYAAMALQCFKKFGCHLKVIQFFLKNANVQTALDYVSKSQTKVDFSFTKYILEKYPKPKDIKGEQRTTAQLEATQLLQSDVVPFSEKETLIMNLLVPLEQGQVALVYMNQQVAKNSCAETQTLFIKTLLATAGDNVQKIKSNIIATLAGPMALVNRTEVFDFCVLIGYHDLALFLIIESKLQKKIEKPQVRSLDDFQIIFDKFDFSKYQALSNDEIMFIAQLIETNTNDATISCIAKLLIALRQNVDWINEDVNKKLALEIRRKLVPSEELLDEMLRQIVVDLRPSDSPLIGVNSIYELIAITKQTVEQLKDRCGKQTIESEEQKLLIASIFAFIYLFTQVLQPCQTCQQNPQHQVLGEQLFDHKACINDSLNAMIDTCGKAIAVQSILQKVGFPTQTKTSDKFNRLGRYSHILSLIQLMLDQDDFTMLAETIFPDLRQQFHQSHIFDIIKQLSNKSQKGNLPEIVKCIKSLVKDSSVSTIKNTSAVLSTLVDVVDGQITDELKIDFNVLDPEVILENLKVFDKIMLQDKDVIIAAAQKILEIVAKLPSQNVEEYMIDLTFNVSQNVESNLIQQKLTELAARKQDTNFWTMIFKKLPKVAELVGEGVIAINGQEVLSYAQASIDSQNLNFDHVKKVMKDSLKDIPDKKFAQNVILQLDVKIGSEDLLIDDIAIYGDSVTITVANLSIENKMFKAASLIFKNMNNHVDAVECLLNNQLMEEAWKYAVDAKDPNAWRIICKRYMFTNELQKSFDAVSQTNQLQMTTDLAREVMRTQNYELHFNLSQYMIQHRVNQQDKFVDSDLAMLFATCMHNNFNGEQTKQQLAQLLSDQQTTINSQQLGDQCFVREMYKPARLFYMTAQNYGALNSVCLKVSDFLGCVQACTKLNLAEPWSELRNELLVQIVSGEELDKSKMLYFFVAQLNLLSTPDDLRKAMQLPLVLRWQIFRLAAEVALKSNDYFVTNLNNLEQTMSRITRALMSDFDTEKDLEYSNINGLILNEVNGQIFDVMAGTYAANPEIQDQTCAYIKKFSKVITVENVLQMCQKFNLSECVTVCYIIMNQTDNAAVSIIDSDGNRDLLYKLVTMSESKQTHAKTFKFILEKHDDDLERFIVLCERYLEPAELMQISTIVEKSAEKLYKVYFCSRVLNANQPLDDEAVNTKFLQYMTEQEYLDDVRKVISMVQNFNKGYTASYMEHHAKFRIIAALLYNQIDFADKCIQILIEEKEIDEAIIQVQITRQRPAATRLLDFAAENDDHLIEILKAVEPILRVDALMAVCWKHKKMEVAMPYVIMSVGRICEKLESEK